MRMGETLEREGTPFRRVFLSSPNLSYPLRTFLSRGFFRVRDAVCGMGFGEVCVVIDGGKAPAQESFWVAGEVRGLERVRLSHGMGGWNAVFARRAKIRCLGGLGLVLFAPSPTAPLRSG